MNPQDLIISIALLIGLGYGFMLGRSRVVGALLGLYAGYAVASLAGPQLGSWLSLDKGSLPWLELVLLWAVALLFIYRFKVDASVGRAHGVVSYILTLLFSGMVGALALVLTVPLLVAAGQDWSQGGLWPRIEALEYLWVSLPLLVWGVLSFLRKH